MVFVSLFRNPIASLLGDALDVGSSCPFGFASTRLFGCGLFACRKSLCSISFPFIIRSTLLWHCSVGRPLLVHHFPAASSLMLNLLGYYASYCSPWSLRSPSTWTARVPPILSILGYPYPIAGPALWPNIFPSRMSASDTQLVEPLSLVKAPLLCIISQGFFYLDACLLFLSEDLGCVFFESIFPFFSLASLGPSP
jgi:hypothetical protein